MPSERVFFQFGNDFLRDAPSAVKIVTKDSVTHVWPVGDGIGVVYNPPEPIAKLHIFYPPNKMSDTVTTGGKRLIRFIEMIPWETVARVEFIYPTVEETDPDKFVIEEVIEQVQARNPIATH